MNLLLADVADTITEPGLYTLAEDVYHADPVTGGSLSVSGAKRLLPPSCPAIFAHERTNGRPDKPAFDFGHAAHAKVLGVGAQIVTVQRTAKDGATADAGDYRTKSAQDHRDEIRAAGKVPLLAAEREQVDAMATALLRHPIAAALLDSDSGTAEQSMFWRDERTTIWLRGRLDFLPHPRNGRMIIPDYKTAPTANPDDFERSVANFGYHMQAAWYRDGAIELGLTDDAEFVFIVQQKIAPYLVSVIQLDLTAMEIGRDLNRRAIDTYIECTNTKRWPGYADDEVALASVPAWYARTYEEHL